MIAEIDGARHFFERAFDFLREEQFDSCINARNDRNPFGNKHRFISRGPNFLKDLRRFNILANVVVAVPS